MAKLFVYGTLQRGHHLNHILLKQGAIFETQAITVKKFSMIFGGWTSRDQIGMYPVVLEQVGRSPAAPIVGEVYKLPDNFDWTYLDRVEGAYDRTMISFSGEPVYMYVGKKSHWVGGCRMTWTQPHSDGNIYWLLPQGEVDEQKAA